MYNKRKFNGWSVERRIKRWSLIKPTRLDEKIELFQNIDKLPKGKRSFIPLRDYMMLLILGQALGLSLLATWLTTSPIKVLAALVSFIVAILLAFVWPVTLGLLFSRWRAYKQRFLNSIKA